VDDLTEEQLATLRHMLGINDARTLRPCYRNYYCASPGDPVMHELARIGAVRLYSNRDGSEWFKCTEAGKWAAVLSQTRRFLESQPYLERSVVVDP
jgi:hypothetical protein